MKRLKIILLVLLAVYVLSGVGLYFIQEKFIFMDESLPQDYQFEFITPFEEVRISAQDAASLHALHFKHESPKGLILYYHGNAQSLRRWGKVVQYHYDLGYDVLVMDYRGYGKSTGKRSQQNLLSDALIWYDHAAQSYADDQITVYGRSLGTGIASYVASQRTPLRLMLETPYHDFKALAQRYYPIFPVGWALRFNFKSYEYIQGVSCPIYIYHGTEDEVVPYSHGLKLYEEIQPGQAEMVTIPEGEHKNLVEFKEFRNAVEEVLE